MLFTMKSINQFTLCSKDGTIGKIREVLFNDQTWQVKYLVADAGNWLIGHKVLISPDYMQELNQNQQCINVDLFKQQVKDAPPLSSDLPVDRQKDGEPYSILNLPPSPLTRLPEDQAITSALDIQACADRIAEQHSWDPQLRSTKASSGLTIEALDGEVGQIEDFIIDDQSWTIRYLVVRTGKWWPGHQILIAPPWISRLSWGTSQAFVNIDRAPFRDLEAFTSIEHLTRDYEIRLHQRCNRIGYWTDDPACKAG